MFDDGTAKVPRNAPHSFGILRSIAVFGHRIPSRIGGNTEERITDPIK